MERKNFWCNVPQEEEQSLLSKSVSMRVGHIGAKRKWKVDVLIRRGGMKNASEQEGQRSGEGAFKSVSHRPLPSPYAHTHTSFPF